MTTTTTTTETTTELPGEVTDLHLCDQDLLCAMSVSLACPDWPDTRRVNDWMPGVTEGDLRWARWVFEQSAVLQMADVDRLIATSDFREADTRERLWDTWGARRWAELGAIARLQDHARAGRPCPAC